METDKWETLKKGKAQADLLTAAETLLLELRFDGKVHPEIALYSSGLLAKAADLRAAIARAKGGAE